MRHNIQVFIVCTVLLAVTEGCVMITAQDYDRARHLEKMLYDGEVVPNVRAFNGHLGGKPLFISTGTSHLLWDKHASCHFPFWDSPFVVSCGELTIAPGEVRSLLLDIQRVSAESRYDRRIVIDCPGSRWDGVFVVGSCGKYVKGLDGLDKYMAQYVKSPETDAPSSKACIWSKNDRDFSANVYAGEIIRNIKAFNPEQGGRNLTVYSHPAWERAFCYFPFCDSPYVLARGEITIHPSEVKPLLLDMQRVSKEQGYKYQIDIECRGSDFRFTIGPNGRYITGIDKIEKGK